VKNEHGVVHRAMPAEVIQLLRHIGTSVKPAQTVSTYNPSTGNEEILYRHARPVLGVHLLVRQNPWVPTFGVGNATVLSSLSAFRAPDDLDPRNSWPYRANTGAGSIHPSADSARAATGLGLAWPARPRKTFVAIWFCRTGTNAVSLHLTALFYRTNQVGTTLGSAATMATRIFAKFARLLF